MMKYQKMTAEKWVRKKLDIL